MAINFPVPSVLNQEHTDLTTGIVYLWVGTVTPVAGFWQVKSAPGESGGPAPGGGNASIFVGDAPPLTPGENQLWWNSNNGRMYIYYDDGNTIQWVETSPGVTTPDALPVGSILPMASTNVPAGFFECDGRELSRVTFSDLFAEIGVLWGAGNGTTTFNVPDLRGEFLRGWDHGRFVDNVGTFTATKTTGSPILTGLAIDAKLIEQGMLVVGSGIPIGSTINSFVVVANVVQSITLNQVVTGSGSISINIFGRKFGSAQEDMLESHRHGLGNDYGQSGGGGSYADGINNSGNNVGSAPSGVLFTGYNGGNETRPRNQAVMYVIKAFATVTNPGLIDVADLAADIVDLQNAVWVSPVQTWTQIALNDILTPKVTLPHGLGYKPRLVTAILICKQALGPYAVGDSLPVYTVYQPSTIFGLQLKWDAVNITYKLHGHAFLIPNIDGAWNADYTVLDTANLDDYFDFVLIAQK